MALVAVVALAFTGVASAGKKGASNSPANPISVNAFEVPASNGYTLVVFGLEEGGRGRGDVVFVDAFKRGREVVYEAPGTVDEGVISARIGRVGRVAVTFHPKGVERVERPCGGGSDYFEAGTFDGLVEFHGREGFTEVALPEASAPPLYHQPGECAMVEKTRGPGKGRVLDAYAKYVHIKAIRNTPTSMPRVIAESGYADGSSRVYLRVETIGGRGAFRPSSDLSRAIVSPPAPFSGSATYRFRGTRMPSWRGDLSVDFPGVPDVAAAGPPAHVELFEGNCSVHDSSRLVPPPGLCF